jgi:hypothetical protein
MDKWLAYVVHINFIISSQLELDHRNMCGPIGQRHNLNMLLLCSVSKIRTGAVQEVAT